MAYGNCMCKMSAWFWNSCACICKRVLRFEQRNLQIEGNNSTCLGNVVEGSMMSFGMHAGHLFVGGGERDQVELSQALPQEENKL